MAHNPVFLKMVNEDKERIAECQIDDVKAKMDQGKSFYLVDTREDSEWEAGRIPGAIHIGKGVLERDIETQIPNKNAEIILYCGGGFRSALAADALQLMEYTNVSSMDGGIRAWRDKGWPIEK